MDKRDYFKKLKANIDHEYCTVEDLQDVINYRRSRNFVAFDVAGHIGVGMIDRTDLVEFVEGLE